MISIEEQLRTAQAKRRLAEAQLHTWLPNLPHYSSRGALEALEAYMAATEGGDVSLTPQEMHERALQWREEVRGEASRLADW